MTPGPPVHHHNQVPSLDLGSYSAGPMLGRIPNTYALQLLTTSVTQEAGWYTLVCQKLQGFTDSMLENPASLQAVEACP